MYVAGPSTWVTKFPMAAGSRQSPVNIETKRAKSDHEALSNKPLRWRYPATASRKLVNPGYCWRVDTDGEGTCEYHTLKHGIFSHFSARILDLFFPSSLNRVKTLVKIVSERFTCVYETFVVDVWKARCKHLVNPLAITFYKHLENYNGNV